jgi:RNA 3'-terminal phosphate cyclase (ATP)
MNIVNTGKGVIKQAKRDNLILIDGSIGEGGGQILRTSLALSSLLLKPFKMINIRANRSNPGLHAQHLKSIESSAKISNAEIEGVKLNSTSIKFLPRKITPGKFKFDIGTAGSTSLVLQTIYLPLSFARSTSIVTITGGTHVMWSPTFDYLKNCWIYFMNRLGFRIKVKMNRAGFYPQGGGEISAIIEQIEEVKPLELTDRGKLLKIQIYSAHTNLRNEVAIRQASAAEKILRDLAPVETIIDELQSYSKNTTIAVTGIFENSIACYTGLGERGKRAEVVAEETCDGFLKFISSGTSAVDEHMADQIILPLSVSRYPSEFTTPSLTSHLLTNMKTIKMFLNVDFKIEELEKCVKVKVIPAGYED